MSALALLWAPLAATTGALTSHEPVRAAASSPLSTVALLSLLALAALAWLRRRTPAPRADQRTLAVIAQAPLGGRARAVWLSAGPRELVVAVAQQGVTVLDHWTRDAREDAAGARDAHGPRARSRAPAAPADARVPQPRARGLVPTAAAEAAPAPADTRVPQPRAGGPTAAAEATPAGPRGDAHVAPPRPHRPCRARRSPRGARGRCSPWSSS
ncbi:MAG: flagellar biosynthetic protein FliO [Kofleriaceae bacterium]